MAGANALNVRRAVAPQRRPARAPCAAAGFSLIELLLAVAIAALVASSAIASLNLFVEMDSRAVQRTEIEIDVDRVLQRVRQDVATATALTLTSDQLQLTQRDGSVVVYAIPAGGTELHRLTAGALLSLLVPLQTLLLGGAVTPQYDARGHLRDATYRATAVLQGVAGIAAAPIRAALDGEVIGVALHVTHAGASGAVVSSCAAVSLALAEDHAKP